MSSNTSAAPSTVSTHTTFFREKTHHNSVLVPISTNSQNTTHTYKYEHHIAPADPTNPPDPLLPPGIIGRPTNTGEQFFREDQKLFQTDLEKFEKQGLDLYELLFSRISTSSKLLAKTQPEYADATRMCCPHALYRILSTSHQTSSATRSLAAILNFLTIRQTTESHPDLVNQINTTHQHVQLSWESALHPGYIRLSDLHSAAYLLALRADKYGAIKERLLSSHPDLRNVDPLQLQTTIQTYTIALDLDAIHIPAAMKAVLPPPQITSPAPYCPLCYERTKKLGFPRKFSNHGVPGKPPCNNGLPTAHKTTNQQAHAFLAIAQSQADKAQVPLADILSHWTAESAQT